MLIGLKVRPSEPDDRGAIESIYPQVFPDEDLLPLLQDLLAEPHLVLSSVAEADGRVVGHIAWTFCGIDGRAEQAALLGPLCVTPAVQKQGAGSALVNAGLERLRELGIPVVCVLGDPQFYRRFGFMPDDRVEPPYPLPPEWTDAWQSIVLAETELPLSGKLSVPEIWQKPALWGP